MIASKFTPEARHALLERIAAGVSLRDACRVVGLREATVKGWLTRGRREDSGPYAEFAQAIEKARQAVKDRREPMDAGELAQAVWTFRDGKIVKVEWFGSRAEALEAAGLSE